MKALFLPCIESKIKVAENKDDLVFTHTTSPDAVKSIIKNSELWMTNIPNFSDRQEVKYGKRIVDTLLNSRLGYWLNKNVGNIGLPSTFVEYYWECVGKAGTNTENFLYDQSFAFCLREYTLDNIEYMWENYNKAPNSVGCMMVFSAGYLCGMFRDKGTIDDAMFLLAPMVYFDIKNDRKRLQREILRFENLITNLKTQEDSNTIQIQTVLALMSLIELLKRKSSKTEEFYKEKEWRIIYAPSLYDPIKTFVYDKETYCKKNYTDNGDEDNMRLVYDCDKKVYKLRLGRWEGGHKCDWNKMLKCIYIGPGNEEIRKKTFSEIKETLALVNACNVEVIMN
ncbi:MAG: hypothetical protein J6N51_04180 [Selenomonas sp.]|nr:hypothetical protein [Selenomonas sp.]